MNAVCASDNTTPSASGAGGGSEKPAYVYGPLEKIELTFPCARQRLFPRRNLLAGPYAGEFGPELMQWQGYVRARRHHYQQVHVLTYPGREYLYEGCHVHTHNISLKNAGYWYGKLSPAEARRIAHFKASEIGLNNYDVFEPSLLCTQYHKLLFWRQEFRLLEEPSLTPKLYDIVLHIRAINKVGPGPVKNYSAAMADELAARCLSAGLSVACIGHPEYAYCPKGIKDYRSADLRQTVAAICSAHLGVGGSSGAMHLINACGKPTFIWGDGTSLHWNPFQVPIRVLTTTTWQPEPAHVCGELLKFRKDLSEKTCNFAKPAYTLPARQIRRF